MVHCHFFYFVISKLQVALRTGGGFEEREDALCQRFRNLDTCTAALQ